MRESSTVEIGLGRSTRAIGQTGEFHTHRLWFGLVESDIRTEDRLDGGAD